MPANIIFLLLCLPALLSTCGSSGPTDEIEIAQERWEATGIENYNADFERICFCPPPSRYTITVEAGVIIRVINTETGEEIDQQNGYSTVDELFEWLLKVASESPQKLELDFHPELGYPALIDYNQSDMIADEERLIRIINLQQK